MNLELKNLVKGQKLDCQCPQCGYRFKIPAEKALTNSSRLQCPKCRTQIGTKQDSSLSKVNKVLKNFGKNLK
jgi:Uncharacterized paraquat-inducible protein A